MQNLRVRFSLENPIIIDRFSTFDSILSGVLLWGIRKDIFKDGILKKVTDEIKSLLPDFRNRFVDFKELYPVLKNYIKIKNDVMSGSTWFIDKDSSVLLDNITLIKKHEPEKILEFNNKKSKKKTILNSGSGMFRAYRFKYETMSVNSIYFYVSADKEFIVELCEYIKFIGKKTDLFFGKVSGFDIAGIKSDKSFMLDDTTPARPLPCKDFKVDSNRIVFWRAYPPYSDKKDKEACYMPNSTLYETQYVKPEGYSSIAPDYISPSCFTMNYKNILQEQIRGKYYCVACGQKTNNVNNISFLTKKPRFNDFPYVASGMSLCDDCQTTQKDTYLKQFSNIFMYNGGHQYFMGDELKESLKGTLETPEKIRADMLLNIAKYPLPFMFSIKTTSKTQHTVFKSMVSISNEMIAFQWGNKTLFIDIPLFKDAVREFKELQIKGIIKTNINALSVEPGDYNSIFFKHENYLLLNEFYKKYPYAVRAMIFWIK